MQKTKKILYIVNFYGSPPLNYFEKYTRELNLGEIYIIKLPAVRLTKGKLFIDSFIINAKGKRNEINIDIRFPFPAAIIFLSQYLLNLILLFKLLGKVKIRQFDICIGETSFGSACAYLLKKLHKVKYSIYMNGDILPDRKSVERYYFRDSNQHFSRLNKLADSIMIIGQMWLRELGSKCDLIWYVTHKIHDWDIKNGIKAENYFFAEAATIDFKEFKAYSKIPKQKNVLGYIGRLDEYAGLDISIECLKYIKKHIPNIRFDIVGGGNASVEHYKEVAKSHGVFDNVKFYGYIPEMSEAFDILSKASLGMALYKPDKTNISLATDVSKVKEYIKVGLPILIAKGGPSVENEIKRYNSGIVVDYDAKKIADAIVDILNEGSSSRYLKLCNGLENHAKRLDYKKHFKYVWEQILKFYDDS